MKKFSSQLVNAIVLAGLLNEEWESMLGNFNIPRVKKNYIYDEFCKTRDYVWNHPEMKDVYGVEFDIVEDAMHKGRAELKAFCEIQGYAA